ncbi:hypothetical protein [Aliarcobacter butzleri]|uniref:hypothetical protein n=1 Tax=Aliarcobacter butzleri TaxID=28197 RepID=UPI0021B68A25|nr:hypothetical protein [Aliarcobacter butzleri]MCT7637055.1 hypothetical protein [Aliarcobacter butzleri]
MAKKKMVQEELKDCSKCNESIKQDNKLHCKIKIKDLNLPFSCYSEVTVKRECGYFKEINK